MNTLRASMRGKVRTLPTYNSGKLDNGGDWSNWTIVVVDEDDNKVKLRVPSQEFGAGLAVGETFDFVLDCSTTGKPRFDVVSYTAAKAARTAA